MKRRYRRFGLWVLLVLLLSSLWGSVLWPRRYVLPQLFGTAVFSVHTTHPMVALTFDDGPDPRYTDRIAELLSTYQVTGTFFMVGKAIQAHPEVAQTVVDLGHEIGNHSWDHHSLNYLGPQAIRYEIESTDQIIRRLGYDGPIPFRPPFGHNLLFLPWVLNQMHRPLVFWNIQLQDWDGLPPQTMLDQLDQVIRGGAIILLHDGDANPRDPGPGNRENTVALVQLILDTYIPQGYHFVSLSDLLRAGPRGLWE